MAISLDDPMVPPPASGSLDYTAPTGGTNFRNQNALNEDDPLSWAVLVGSPMRPNAFDSRQAKVAEQLDVPYTPGESRKWKYQTIGGLLRDFDALSRKEFLTFRNRLAAAGWVDPDSDALTVRMNYEQMLQNLAQMQQTQKRLSMRDYIDNLIRMNGIDPSQVGVKKKKKYVSTSKTVYELDPAEAKQMMISTLQNYLGRDPTRTEIQDYMNAVQTRSEDDPTTTTKTTVVGPNGQRSTTSTDTDYGFTQADAENLAMEQAKASPGYGEYQAVSQYFPVLEQLLSAPV